MSKHVNPRRWIVLALFSISILLIACLSLQVPMADTPGAASGPTEVIPMTEAAGTPNAIHFPEVESPRWVKTVSSLCILVDQSYSSLPPSYTQPIGEELQNIFKRIGVEASLGEGADCQATLSIQIAITPIAEQVVGAGSCYLDALAIGKATLSAPGQETLEMTLRAVPSQGTGITFISECPETPAEAPIGGTWRGILVDMLGEWWGSPALVSILIDSNYDVNAITALGQIGDDQALQALIQTLHNDDWYLRYEAASALTYMGPEAAPAVPELIEAIDDEERQVGRAAIDTLGAIGPDAKQAIPKLIEMLEDEDYSISALGALQRITGQYFGEDAKAWRHWWETQP